MPTRSKRPEAEKPSQRGLSIYLLQPSYEKPGAALRQIAKLTKFSIRVVGAKQCFLWVQRPPPNPPRWAAFFEDVLDPSKLGRVSGSGAVLLLTVDGVRFAIAFGYGRHLLDPASYDERFGLRVTLNAVDPAQLKTIDKDTFENVARHTREQVSRSTTITGFGLNIDQDLIRAVEGTPSDGGLGTRLAGRDALHATVSTTLNGLPALLKQYARLAKETTYRKHFPWIDNIKAVRNAAVIAALDNQLSKLLNDRTLKEVWLTPPIVTDWPSGGYRYGEGKRAMEAQELRLGDYLDHAFPEREVTVEALKTKHILPLTPEETPKERWTTYQCLYAELQDGDRIHILSAGHWYEIDRDFVRSVNRAVAAIPETALALPACGRETEKDYNDRVARDSSGNIAKLDRAIIFHGGGASQVEACDLYTKERQIVHVKHYDNGSSALSHLFAQARVSAELLLQDEEFRQKFNAKLPLDFRLPDIRVRPKASGFEIVFAVISRSATAARLPFFSRVNLRQTHRALSAYGYNVTIANIRKIA